MLTRKDRHWGAGARRFSIEVPALRVAAATLFTVTLLAAPNVSAQEAEELNEARGQVEEVQSAPLGTGTTLGLSDAIARSLEESPSVRLAELELQDARISYEQAKAANLLKGSQIALATAESAWNVAQRNYEIALQQLKGEVEETYYGVLRGQYALALSEKALTTSERQLAVTEAELQQGVVSEVELLSAKSDVASAEATVASAEADLAAARMRFNQIIGLDLSAEVELADEFTYEAVSLDLDAFVRSALEGRVELVQARDALERSEQELETKQNDYTPDLEQKQAKNALERAKISLRQQEATVRLDVRQKYEATLAALRAIELREQGEAIAEEQLRIAKLQRGAGILTDLDVLDAERAYQEAQTDSLQAVFDYNIALLQLYRAAGMERP